MKKNYPKYRDRITTYLIEKNMSEKQKKILNDYLSFLSTTAGKGKVLDYRRYMLQFYDIVEKDLDKLEPQDIIDFASLLNQDDTRETNTKNVIKVAVKRFVKWFYSDNAKMMNVLNKLNQKYILVNEEKINKGTLLKPEEIELLLRTAESLKLKSIIVTLNETACRPHELRTAKFRQIDWKRKILNVYASKTKKSRPIPLNESIIHLKRWKQEYQYPNVSEDDYIYPSPQDRNKPIGSFEFGYWIRTLGKKAGIKRPVYCYLFRHSRLTELHNKYKLQDQVHKKFAGHSPKSDMTGVYVNLDNDDMIQSVVSQVYHVEEISPENKLELEKMNNVIMNQSDLIELLILKDRKMISEKEFLHKAVDKIKLLSVYKKNQVHN